MSETAAPPITTRTARETDAAQMCAIINPIIAKGGTTAHRNPFSEERMIGHYIASPSGICCTLALAGDEIIGFQGLFRVDAAQKPEGWGSVGTFVRLGRQGGGIGRILFAQTLQAAREAGLHSIDATIATYNHQGQAFYDRLGFVTYGEDGDSVFKRFDVA